MADDGGIAVLFGQINRIQSFTQRTDLIELNQNGVGNVFVDAFLENFWIGDK